ncbi:MAG: diguanylate cyclase [Gammaproteobacteria bacterium]|nr:diguanylate cyclase [Gammaproteobacteria bacterium]
MTAPANLKGSLLNQLKRWMILLLVVLQALTVISILFFSSLANESALLSQAQKILNGATKESIRTTEAFLDHAYHEVSLTSQLFASDVLDTTDIDRIESYFLNQLDQNEAFAGIYLGTTTGDFLYVSRDATGERGAFRVKHVMVLDEIARTTLWWRDDSSDRLAMTPDPADRFDPRIRPWFQDALAADDFIWTDPYIFFTAQSLGITAAHPVRDAAGNRIGVIGVDLDLQALAGFLAELDISESGSAFITNNEGLLLATPTMLGRPTHDLALLSIDAMADPISRKVLETIRTASRSTDKRNAAGFTVGKTRYISDSMPLQLADGEQWLIGTYAPRSDFLSDIREGDQRNIFLAVGILLIALLIGVLLATTAWTPLELLHFQANRDQLTRIFNRHYLMKFGKRLFNDAIAQDETLSAAIVDLDHFKQINDTFGHAAGDAVIKEMAQRLQNASRAHDLVARYGGEEFVMLLPTADSATAQTVLERARDDLKENPIEFHNRQIPVTFSAGICEMSDALNSMEPVLNTADRALYRAKSEGRDRIVVATLPRREVTPEETEAAPVPHDVPLPNTFA